MEKCSTLLGLTLGYNETISMVQNSGPVKGLREGLGSRFSRVIFKVDHLAANTYRIKIKLFGIPTAQGGLMDRAEVVTGLVGDALRLTNGRFLKIEGPGSRGLLNVRIGDGSAVTE